MALQWTDPLVGRLRHVLSEVCSRLPGSVLPTDYLILDAETSGLDVQADRIIQLAVCLVRPPKAAGDPGFDCFSTYINQDVAIHPGAFAVHGISKEVLIKEGMVPTDVFTDMTQLIREAVSRGKVVCGHNLVAFDLPRLDVAASLAGLPGLPPMPVTLDTGMIVKAARIGVDMILGEPLHDFYIRVGSRMAAGARWSLHAYCSDAFDLPGKDKRLSETYRHRAAADCIRTWALVERFREILNGTWPPVPVQAQVRGYDLNTAPA